MKIVLHLGLPKTGTTYLQNYVFPNIQDITYLGKPFTYESMCSLTYNRSETVLISNESYLAQLNSKNMFNSNIYWNEYCVKAIERLSSFYKGAEVILVFRKHKEFIESLYKQYIKVGGTYNFNKFYSFRGNSNVLIKASEINYSTIINACKKYFKGNLFIFDYECMNKEGNDFIEALSLILGVSNIPWPSIKSNIGLGVKALKLLRIINRIDSGNTVKCKNSLIPLTNRYTKHLKISPYHIINSCFYNRDKHYIVPITIEKEINGYYKNDWHNTEVEIALTKNRLRCKKKQLKF